MTEPEVLQYFFFGLRLGIVLGARVATRVNFGEMSQLSRESAQEYAEEIADDALLEEISVQLGDLFERTETFVFPGFQRRIPDYLFTADDDFDRVLECYNDLLMNGEAAQTFADALAVLDHLHQLL